MIYPVGIIVEFSVNTDPNVVYPETKWEEFASGRVLIGSGTYTDINSKSLSWSLGEADSGEYQHKLTVAEMPKHTHPMPAYDAGYDAKGSGKTANTDNIAEFNTKSSGGDTPHNNVQPYAVVKRWTRTS